MFASRRDIAEMVSTRSVAHAGAILVLSLLCWWTARVNPIASGLFFFGAFWTLMRWLVHDRDS